MFDEIIAINTIGRVLRNRTPASKNFYYRIKNAIFVFRRRILQSIKNYCCGIRLSQFLEVFTKRLHMAEQCNSRLGETNIGSLTKTTSSSAVKATVDMGRKIDMFNYVRALMVSRNSKLRQPHIDIPHNILPKTLSNAMSSLKNCHLLTNGDSLKHAYGQRQDHHDDNTRLLYIMAGIDSVPLLSLIFFIFVGIETELPSVETSICVVSLAFNWMLIAIFILFCSACCTPLFFRILKRHQPSPPMCAFEVNSNKHPPEKQYAADSVY